MTRDWKAGDVALVNGDVCLYDASRKVWEHGRPDRFAYNLGPAIPLAVIDPWNAEGFITDAVRCIERRMSLDDTDRAYVSSGIEAALREFADKPPKPDEPTGLGAVVEDADGADWHRTRAGRWLAADGLHTRSVRWHHVHAVRVLSEGVQS